MITLRRANERHHSRRHRRTVWFTFYSQDRADPLADGFGALATLDEHRLPPGASAPSDPPRDAEIITYVMDGALALEGSLTCCSGVIIRAGEFQRLSTGCGNRHDERNASRTDWTRVLRISLHLTETGLDSSHEQRRFSTAERRGVLRVVASPEGRTKSLRIRQDALIYSAMLDPGNHLIHELLTGRRAWLHVVHGQVTNRDVALTTGDGIGFTEERAVSFTAREDSEVLLFDLGERPATPTKIKREPESDASPGRRNTSDIAAWEAEGGA